MRTLRAVLLTVLILVCVGVIANLLFEESMIFFPTRGGVGKSPGEDVFLTTSDGVQIHGWFVSAPDALTTLLWFHGNGGNLENRRERVARLATLPANVLVIDYRGYGKSEGRPSEKGVYRDAQAAYDWLTRDRNVAPERIVLFGDSLGGAVACDLAARVKCAGLIMQSSFTDMADVAELEYPGLPMRYLMRTKFDNIRKLPRIRVPKLIMHAEDDELIPFNMGERLYAAAAPPKEYAWFKRGGHNGIGVLEETAYYARLRKFLLALNRGR